MRSLSALLCLIAMAAALVGCEREPCHGQPEKNWNAEGTWGFLGELPVGEKGAVCGADEDQVDIDHGLAKDKSAEVRKQWKGWLADNGWTAEPAGPWNKKEREEEFWGERIGIYGKGNKTIRVSLLPSDVGLSSRVEWLHRIPFLPVDENLFKAGEARLDAVRKATSAWQPDQTTECNAESLEEVSGEKGEPLIMIDRRHLELMDKKEEEAFGQYTMADRLVRAPERVSMKEDHVGWSRSINQRRRRAKAFEMSPMVFVFHATAEDLQPPKITSWPGRKTADGKPLTTFTSGKLSGHALLADADAGQVLCHFSISVENDKEFETPRKSAMEALWVDLMVQTQRAIDAKVAQFPVLDDFKRRGSLVAEATRRGP
ncbi:hypothetical protein FIV42_26140 [Persicimonas caeni]|uniref:Lipoprotein n=1 Tax=Persicimonas caeni TaxID=2292766 RepID=A0A4Y6Q0K2_PERCE|nr:hypothetical protein [Persicimonas caeni]QDG54094.1 hypothetical protein FIV42_26140 [Persicimonas caeni]QED35315.1 hypothetical protein FRD00_26135 [Persicimonas caeni]